MRKCDLCISYPLLATETTNNVSKVKSCEAFVHTRLKAEKLVFCNQPSNNFVIFRY